MRELDRQGYDPWPVLTPPGQIKIVGYNHDVPLVREVYVCLESTSMKSLGRLRSRPGVSVEVWTRKAGETAFQVTKL
jgi:hypothetical protein